MENEQDSGMRLLFSECFETDRSLPYPDRLLLVGNRARDHIDAHQPDCVALEKLFFSKNKRTAMAIAEVRGSLITVARSRGADLFEYGPSTVKKSVTGNGSAGKSDIVRMIRRLIRIDEKKRYDDEYDAIAIGITHLLASRNPFIPHQP